MKEYNRVTRKWEEPVEKTGSLKTKKLCRGNKPHSYLLVLPKHYRIDCLYYTEEVAQEFYNSQARIREFMEKENDVMRSLHIKTYGKSLMPMVRHYECEVCGKHEYDIIK